MFYSAPYLFFLLILFLICLWEFSIKHKGSINIIKIRILIWFLFVFFFGFRGFVNTDCANYYPFFRDLKVFHDGISLSQVLSSYNFEPGFVLTTFLLKSIVPNYHFWIFLWTIIALLGIDFLFVRYSKYYSLSFLLFFVFGGYEIVTNLMRASVAITLFLFSMPALLNGKFRKYLFLNAIGCLFHISSVVYILVYPILRIKLPSSLLYPILIGIFVLGMLGLDVTNLMIVIINILPFERINLLFENYLDTTFIPFISIGTIERFVSFLLVCLFYNKLLKEDKSNVVFLNSYVLYFIFFYSFSNMGAAAYRLAGLFLFSYWIFYAKLFQILKTSGRKAFFLFVLVTYSVLKLISGMSVPCHQYKNILWSNERFEEAEGRLRML